MAKAHLLVLLLVCAIPGCGCPGGRAPSAGVPPAGPAKPPMAFIDPDAPPTTAEAYATIAGGETLGDLVARLGPAHVDEGSGLYVLVWRGADGRYYYASVSSLTASARPLGAGFVDR